ncbi:MAG: hypothetical protein ACD_29C00390G0002 [uncultured bacterium]|nr:MAG: hypothetical protein ACD_29C00390G0002 [uncultured bacterium]
MIYVTVPYKLKPYANNRWVAPPADLLLPLLTQSLRSIGYFRAVVTSPFSGMTTYQLNTRLLMLQQEFLQPISQVRFILEVTLMQSLTGKIISNRVFSIVVSAPNNNPYGGVLATNQAANALSKQIAQFVVQKAKSK